MTIDIGIITTSVIYYIILSKKELKNKLLIDFINRSVNLAPSMLKSSLSNSENQVLEYYYEHFTIYSKG